VCLNAPKIRLAAGLCPDPTPGPLTTMGGLLLRERGRKRPTYKGGKTSKETLGKEFLVDCHVSF